MLSTATTTTTTSNNTDANTKFQCSYFNRGCDIRLESFELGPHVLSCRYGDGKCRDCGELVPRFSLSLHQSKYCMNRDLNCNQCGKTYKAVSHAEHVINCIEYQSKQKFMNDLMSEFKQQILPSLKTLVQESIEQYKTQFESLIKESIQPSRKRTTSQVSSDDSIIINDDVRSPTTDKRFRRKIIKIDDNDNDNNDNNDVKNDTPITLSSGSELVRTINTWIKKKTKISKQSLVGLTTVEVANLFTSETGINCPPAYNDSENTRFYITTALRGCNDVKDASKRRTPCIYKAVKGKMVLIEDIQSGQDNDKTDDEENSMEEKTSTSKKSKISSMYNLCDICDMEVDDEQLIECKECQLPYHIKCANITENQQTADGWNCQSCTTKITDVPLYK